MAQAIGLENVQECWVATRGTGVEDSTRYFPDGYPEEDETVGFEMRIVNLKSHIIQIGPWGGDIWPRQ